MPGAMIASRVPGWRWLLALLLAAIAVTAWQARPRPPLSLASMLERPSWQLRITKVRAGCFGPELRGDFRIASTGEVTWTRGPGWPVRRLALPGEQLALVRRLGRLPGAEPQPDDHYFLVIGPDRGELGELAVDGGAHVSPASELGATVTAMLDELMDRHVPARQASIASMDLQLETTGPGAVYRVRVAGGRLTVDRGRTRRLDTEMHPALLIDLVDAALEQHAAAEPDDDVLGVDEPDVTGVLHVGGRSIPLALARHRRGAFDLIHGAIASARHFDFDGRASTVAE